MFFHWLGPKTLVPILTFIFFGSLSVKFAWVWPGLLYACGLAASLRCSLTRKHSLSIILLIASLLLVYLFHFLWQTAVPWSILWPGVLLCIGTMVINKPSNIE